MASRESKKQPPQGQANPSKPLPILLDKPD